MAWRYSVTVSHEGLGKYRVISGTVKTIVEAKARAQALTWERQYHDRLQGQAAKQARDARRASEKRGGAAAETAIEASNAEARKRTNDARAAIEQVENTLHATLMVNDAIDWERLKNTTPFAKPEPLPPEYLVYPDEPTPES